MKWLGNMFLHCCFCVTLQYETMWQSYCLTGLEDLSDLGQKKQKFFCLCFLGWFVILNPNKLGGGVKTCTAQKNICDIVASTKWENIDATVEEWDLKTPFGSRKQMNLS